MTEHIFKQQTPEHQATMKVMLGFLLEEGYTKEDIIDCGDYILDQMTLEELTGAKKDDKQHSKKKGAKGSSEPEQDDSSAKPAKSKAGKEGKKEKGKGKGKKGKGAAKKGL